MGAGDEHRDGSKENTELGGGSPSPRPSPTVLRDREPKDDRVGFTRRSRRRVQSGSGDAHLVAGVGKRRDEDEQEEGKRLVGYREDEIEVEKREWEGGAQSR